MSEQPKHKPVAVPAGRLAMLAMLFHFCLLGGYYLVRPVRDEISTNLRGELAQLWTLTFVYVSIVTPIYTVIIARIRRQVFLPAVYGVLVTCLAVFYVLLQSEEASTRTMVERVFYIWSSVINLLAVSVFWSFASDLFTREASKRWFGLIAMAGSVGAIAGAWSVGQFTQDLGRTTWLLLTGACWLVCAGCVLPMHRWSMKQVQRKKNAPTNSVMKEVVGSFVLAGRGLARIVYSPYLLGIATFILLLALGNSFLYYERSWLVGEAIIDRAKRTEFLANIDLYVNTATALVQGGIVAWLMRKLGVGLTLGLLPTINLLGFLVLGALMLDDIEALKGRAGLLLGVLMAFEVAQRVGRYAFARPSRESLFTVVDHSERYQSKAFIDTVVYRGGDTVGGWAFTGLRWLGLSLGATALVTLPVFAGGIVLSLWLGRKQMLRRDEQTGTSTDTAPETHTDTQ